MAHNSQKYKLLFENKIIWGERREQNLQQVGLVCLSDDTRVVSGGVDRWGILNVEMKKLEQNTYMYGHETELRNTFCIS